LEYQLEMEAHFGFLYFAECIIQNSGYRAVFVAF